MTTARIVNAFEGDISWCSGCAAAATATTARPAIPAMRSCAVVMTDILRTPLSSLRARALPVLQAEAVGVERTRLARHEPCLGRRLRPRPRELPGRLRLAEEDVRDPRALGAGQPRGDERLPARELLRHDERAAGDEHDDDRDLRLLQVLEHDLVGAVERQLVGAVAVRLGVRPLAEHGDRDVVALRAGAVGADVDMTLGVDGLLDPGEDRRPGRDRAGRALPRDRPSARLQPDVVRALARDEDLLP